MPVAILILVLLAFAYAMASTPRARVPGAIAGVVIAAGLGWYFFSTSSETVTASRRITIEDLRIDQLQLDQTVRGATLRGRVENLSETGRLREMTIEVRLFDCPDTTTGLEECAIIADGSAIARVDVPPGQLRAFSGYYVFPDRPAVTGDPRWDSRISAVRATEY
jgi:hypothetical protein